jgi:TonB family protein
VKRALQALPWVIAFGAHALILFVPFGIQLPASFTAGDSSGAAAVVTVALPVNAAAVVASRTGENAPAAMPAPPSVTVKGGKKAVSDLSYNNGRGVLGGEGSAPVPSTESLPTPSASEVLGDIAASGPVTVPARTSPSPVGPATVTDATGLRVAFSGSGRSVIRKSVPVFPSVLSAAGQEVEGEARITVSPSGSVTRVEITKSSGYTEIDASVEAALFNYLFSRVDGRVDSVGTVTFRFRLEKQD